MIGTTILLLGVWSGIQVQIETRVPSPLDTLQAWTFGYGGKQGANVFVHDALSHSRDNGQAKDDPFFLYLSLYTPLVPDMTSPTKGIWICTPVLEKVSRFLKKYLVTEYLPMEKGTSIWSIKPV